LAASSSIRIVSSLTFGGSIVQLGAAGSIAFQSGARIQRIRGLSAFSPQTLSAQAAIGVRRGIGTVSAMRFSASLSFSGSVLALGGSGRFAFNTTGAWLVLNPSIGTDRIISIGREQGSFEWSKSRSMSF
jgi:hypothetical protein